MKKIGLLILVIVLSLGALGIGYAAWTDTVTISGTINTGNVDLVVEGYSGMFVWKVPGAPNDMIITRVVPPVAPPGAIDMHPETPAIEPVASAAAHPVWDPFPPAPGQKPVDDAIGVNFVNLFPIGEPFVADYLLHYVGSIPVKVQISNLAIKWAEGSDPNECLDYGITARVSRDGGTTWEGPYDAEELVGIQLHQSNRIEVQIWININNCENPAEDVDNMGLNGTITGEIKVIQWNEYVPPLPSFPECAPATCSTFIPCAIGGNCGSAGVCGSIVEGGGICVYGPTSCASLEDCPGGTPECPVGEVCTKDSCCGENKCVGATEACYPAEDGATTPSSVTGEPSFGG